MTVTKVLGYGLQKGNTEYYRGAEVSVHLLPKVKVELVVSAIPVAAVVAAAKKVLYTGKYGDGKIFIYDVENVVKIRTVNIDLWNYWHFAFIGAVVYFASDNIWWGVSRKCTTISVTFVGICLPVRI